MANQNERIDVNINTTTNMPKEIRQTIESARKRNEEIDSLKSQISELRGIITTKESSIVATYYKGGGTSGATPVLRDNADLKELQATRKSIEADREKLKELNKELQNMERVSQEEINKIQKQVSETKARLTRSKQERENPSPGKAKQRQQEYNEIKANATAPSKRKEKGKQSFESKGILEATKSVLSGESTKIVEDKLKALEQRLVDYTQNIASINNDIQKAEQMLNEAETNLPAGDKRIQDASKQLKTLKSQLESAQTNKKRTKAEAANVRNHLKQMQRMASQGESGFISSEHARRAMSNGQAIPLKVALDTSWDKNTRTFRHQYDYTGPGAEKYLQAYGRPISVTTLTGLLTGQKSPKQLREEAQKTRNARQRQDLLDQARNTERAAKFGTAHHRLVEGIEKGEFTSDTMGIRNALAKLAAEERAAGVSLSDSIYSDFLDANGNLIDWGANDKRGGSALIRTVQSYQKWAENERKQGRKVHSSEEALGMLMRVGNRVVPIAGTQDQLWLMNETAKDGSPLYGLKDIKTTSEVKPGTAIQDALLAFMNRLIGRNVQSSSVIHTSKEAGRATQEYMFDQISDSDLVSLIDYALQIRDAGTEEEKAALRDKAASLWKGKMHGVVGQATFTKDGKDITARTYNGKMLYEIMKYNTGKRKNHENILDIYNSFNEEGRRQFSNDLWLTETAADGSKDYSKLVRTGDGWDEMRSIIPSAMGLAVRGQNTGGAEFKEFTTEDGKTMGGMSIGGLYGSEWVKAYELAVAQEMQRALKDGKAESEARKLAQEAGQKVIKNMASLIDKELKRKDTGPEGDAAYLNARSFLRSFENSYLYNPNASRAIDAFGQIDMKPYGGLYEYYREQQDADLGGEAQYQDKETQAEARRRRTLSEDSGIFAQKMSDLSDKEIMPLLNKLSGEASNGNVMEKYANAIQSMFSNLRSYSSIWKEALYTLGNESELDEFGKPEVLNNAMSILDTVSNFKNAIREKIANSNLSDKDKQTLTYRLNDSLNLENTQNPVLGQQVGYRLTRGIAAYDYYNSILEPYRQKANQQAIAQGGRDVSPTEFAQGVLSKEQLAQYEASRYLKDEYMNFVDPQKGVYSSFENFMDQMSASPIIQASREMGGLFRQWQEAKMTMDPDVLNDIIQKILAQQIYNERGLYDPSKQFSTFGHGLVDVGILEGRPIDRLGYNDTEKDLAPGVDVIEQSLQERMDQYKQNDAEAFRDLEEENAKAYWENVKATTAPKLKEVNDKIAELETSLKTLSGSELAKAKQQIEALNKERAPLVDSLRKAQQSLETWGAISSKRLQDQAKWEFSKGGFAIQMRRDKEFKNTDLSGKNNEELLSLFDSAHGEDIAEYKRLMAERQKNLDVITSLNTQKATLEGKASLVPGSVDEQDIASVVDQIMLFSQEADSIDQEMKKMKRAAGKDSLLRARYGVLDKEFAYKGMPMFSGDQYAELKIAQESAATSRIGADMMRADAPVMRELRGEQEDEYRKSVQKFRAKNAAEKERFNSGGVGNSNDKKPHEPPQTQRGGVVTIQSGEKGFVVVSSGDTITPEKPTKSSSGALVPYTPGYVIPYAPPETSQGDGGTVEEPPQKTRKTRSDKGKKRGPRKQTVISEDDDTTVLPPPQKASGETTVSQPITVNGTQQTVANGPVNIQVASGNVQIDISASNVAENITNSTIQMIRGAVGGGGSGDSGGGSGGGNGGNTGDASNQAADGDANRVKSLTTISQLLNQHISLYKEIEKENRTIALLAQDQSDEGKLATKEAKDRRRELMEMRKDVRTQIKEEYGKLTPEAQTAFGEKARVRIQGARQSVAIQDTRALYDARDESAKEYERLLTTRLQIESKIDQFEQRRNTTGWGPEIDALRAAIEGQQKLLALNQEDLNVLKQRGLLRAEDAKRIEAQYAAQRSAQKASNATNMHATRNIWDMMGYDIKRSFSMIFNFGVAHRAIASIRMQIQQLITTLKDLDVAMTNIRIVTGQTNEEATELMKTYNDLASQLGTTTKAIAEASNEWLRQGYTVSESQDLITASTYLSKLGMIDASQATEYLTSLLKGFKLEASEAADAVSMLTKLDMEFAASSGDIAEGLSRMATTAQMAGMSLEEAAAAATVIKDVSQKSASSIGESLKTLLSRYGNVKAGSFVDLETGEADESLNDTEKVLNAIGISIRSSSMEFRDFSDALDELADKWATLSSVEKNAVATAMAGTRQRENFNILMENYNSYEDAVKSASDSEGVAQRKYEAYLDSIEAHINKLQTAWESLVQTFQGSDFYKFVIGLTTKLVENLPIIFRNLVNILTLLNAYKMPIWLKQLGGLFTAPSAHSGRFIGAYGGMVKGTLSRQGREDRANIMNYEFYKARAGVNPKAAEKMKEYETKLPQGYRDKMLSSSSVDVQPVVTKTEEVKQVLQGIGSNVARIAGTPSGAAVPVKTTAHGVGGVVVTNNTSTKVGADPAIVNQYKNDIKTLEKQRMSALGRKGGHATKYYSMAESDYDDVESYKAKMNAATGEIVKYDKAISAKEADLQKYLDSCGLESTDKSSNKIAFEQGVLGGQGAFGNQVLTLNATNVNVFGQRINQGGAIGQNGSVGEITADVLDGKNGDGVLTNKNGASKNIGDAIDDGVGKKIDDVIGDGVEKASKKVTSGAGKKGILSKFGGLFKANGALSLVGGLTSAITAFATTEGDTKDKAISAGVQGGTTLIGSLVGGPIGGMIGSLLGQFVTPYLLDLVNAEEKAREERVKEAQEQLKALQEITSSVDGLSDALREREDWDSEDYQQVNDYIDETRKLLREDSEARKKFLEIMVKQDSAYSEMEYREILNLIRDGTQEQADAIVAAIGLAVAQRTSEEGLESKEIDINNAQKKAKNSNDYETAYVSPPNSQGHYYVSSAQRKKQEAEYSAITSLEGLEGVKVTTKVLDDGAKEADLAIEGADSFVQLQNAEDALDFVNRVLDGLDPERFEERYNAYSNLAKQIEKQIGILEEANAEIEDAYEEINASKIQEAILEGIGDWDSVKIKTSQLDEAISAVADYLTLMGEEVYTATGELTDTARSQIEAYLREQDKFSALFSEDEASLRELLKNQPIRQELEEESGMTYEELRNLFETHGVGADEARQNALDVINSNREEGNKLTMDEFRNKVYSVDSSRLEEFASALGMTVENVEDLQDVLGDASLADLLAVPEDTVEKIEAIGNIFSDIVEDGKVTFDNYKAILDTYPELLNKYDESGKLISVSTENIQDNIIKMLKGEGGSLDTILSFNMYEDLKSNTSLYDSFKQMLKEATNANGENKFTSEQLSFLNNFTTFTDDMLGILVDNEDMWNMYSDFMGSFTMDTELFQATVESLIDYQTTLLDEEISGLEEQKDLLSEINDQREKELELIKARQKLENAQKEKRAVYREGIGWTYESDQTAIKEARDEIEELETQKDQDDLQYQIDQLEAQKTFLEAIPTAQELEAQKELYESWMNSITENGKKQTEILDTLSTLYQRIGEITNNNQWANADKEMLATTEGEAYAALHNSESSASISNVASAISDLQNLTDLGKNHTEEYNERAAAAEKQYNEMRENLVDTGIGDYLDMGWEDFQNTDSPLKGILSSEKEFEQLKSDYDYYVNGKFQFSDLFEQQNISELKGRFKNNTGGEVVTAGGIDYITVDRTTKGAVLGGTSELMSNYNDGPYVDTKKTNRMYMSPPGSTEWAEISHYGDDVKGSKIYNQEEMKTWPKGTMVAFGTDKGDLNNHPMRYAWKGSGDQWYKANVAAARVGSFGLPGGPTLINEVGTEGIITPQGTLTALPSKTGIVPADITRSLYNLGTIAPNLIKELDSNKIDYSTFGAQSSSDDHSMNIGNLYATFQADENFDFDKFLVDVRSAISLNKHHA